LPNIVVASMDAVLEASIVGSFSRIGYLARRRVAGWDDIGPGAMRGRIALVTGASSGLGLATAQGLAAAGATVVLLGRDPDRTDSARAAILDRHPEAAIEVVVADLTRLDDVRRAASEVIGRHDRLDVVVHNAGTLVHHHELTVDGIEVTAQTHVVAPFLLTASLLPVLVKTPGARVIHVVSGGLYTARLSVEALAATSPDGFDGVDAYAQAKRASLVLAEQWAARTAGTTAHDLRFHAMHPGWADTPGVRDALPTFHRLLAPVLRTPEEGVDTTVWLAASDIAHSSNGQLWLDRHPRRTTYLPRTATPDVEANRLWQWCLKRCGLDDPLGAVTTTSSTIAPISTRTD
jgi:NAD(P)-dependent dehydrogenase (short-subunit alcohol dehydrogenase family)